MADSISFKAYLKRTGQEAEVRRFGIDTGAASSFVYLRSKIQTIFPSIQNDQFSIFWHDGDDFISIDTDEELVVALTNNPVQPIKLHVHVAAKSQPSAGTAGSYEPQAHVGVSCDGCDNGITGYRYKCVSCPDFDLCSRCEAKNLHPEHIMIRMSMPLSPHMRSKFFRKMFGRPHKFAKRFEHWNRESGCSGQAPPSGGCPFMREEGPQAAPGPKVSDMFDFSALMDFINTLGVVVDDKRPAEPTASASSSAQAQAQPGREPAPGASGSQPAPGAEYLTSVGQAIQAFLDPFEEPKEKKNLKKKNKLTPLKRNAMLMNTLSYKPMQVKSGAKSLKKHLRDISRPGVEAGETSGEAGPRGRQRSYFYRPGSLFVYDHRPADRHGPKFGTKHGHGDKNGHSSKHGHGDKSGHGPKHGHGPKNELPRSFCLKGADQWELPLPPWAQGKGKSLRCFPARHVRFADGRMREYFLNPAEQRRPVDLTRPTQRDQQALDQALQHISLSDEEILLQSSDESGGSEVEVVTIHDDNEEGVNVSFDVRPPKASETAAASTPTAPTSTPTAPTSTPTASTSTPTATTSTAAATTSTAAATSTPTAPAPGFILPRAAATPAPATPVPAADQIWDAMMRDNYGAAAARRNSDDWTLVNRESPTRSEEAMAVDGEENRAARAGAVYPELPRETPAAAAASAPVDPEAQRVQDAIEKIRAMGFSIDPNILKELLSNQDIATVLEMLLGGGSGKK